MAKRPLYYGSDKGSPMYYGKTATYGGKNPMYYGAGRNYGGQYGGTQYGGSEGGNADDGTIIGTLTLSRILRVISQRWLSIFVFALIGLIVSFAIYRISPTIYESRSEFTMDMRRSSGQGGTALDSAMPDLGSSYTEVFNTRLSDWQSRQLLLLIVQEYRSNHPASVVSEEELYQTLANAKLELIRNSRLITISVRSKSAELAAHLANSYAQAIEAFTDKENKLRCDKAVSEVHSNVEKHRREKDRIAKELLEFRTINKVDNLRSMRETVQQALSKTTQDLLALESEELKLIEFEKILRDVQKDPNNFGALSSTIQRAQEISERYQKYMDASSAYATLKVSYTDKHPGVIAAAKELEACKKHFVEAVERALQAGIAGLSAVRNQLSVARRKQEDLRNELSSVEQRIVYAESGLSTLESEFNIANEVLQGLILKENEQRIAAESNNEIVRVGRPAEVPKNPVLPNPLIIFGVGIVLSIALGVLFVLVLDNLEDTIINLSDIENRLSLRVLAVLPHVRQKSREHVAHTLIHDPYSQFAEVVAGLRNMLDSPRYESMSQTLLFISTQPGEGKTICSTSLAISYAQAGRRVLHVDFDLRRPRLARIWNIDLPVEKSFSMALQNYMKSPIDFHSLVTHIDNPSIDVICSLPPEDVVPATIFGSKAMTAFFAWAKANYDRIIVDAPPFGLVGDVVTLASLVDSVLIMCCPDRTHFKPVYFCSRSLVESGANLLGIVVNDVETGTAEAFSPAIQGAGRAGYGYGYGYHYGYGYSSKRSASKAKSANKNAPAEGGQTAPEAQHPETNANVAAPAPKRPAEKHIDSHEFTDDE